MSHPSFARRTLAILSLLLAAIGPARAATIVWTNTAGGNWNTTNNWSPNTVPASGDTVFITNAGTYTVTIDVSPTLAALTVGNTNGGTVTVALASPTLTLNGASFFNTNSVFNFSGGLLDGTGTVVFAGQFNWSGGQMDSTTPGGKTVFTNTASVTLNGSTKVLYRRSVDNYTTVNWSAGTIQNGVAPLWVNMSGSVLDVQGDLFCQYAGSGYLTINNGGTIKKSAGAGQATLQCAINNGGLASSQSGVLSLDRGGNSSGCTFSANAGCVLQFGAGTQTLFGSCGFTGAGVHRINGGTVNIAALTTVSPSFELAAGSLDGTNTIIFTGPFTWSGGLMNGTTPGGKTVFTNSATVTINGGTKIFYGRTVDNYTTANWTAGVIQNGVAPVWNNLTGSVFDVQGDMFCQYAGSGYLTFNNSGTLKKSAGVGTATLQCIVNNTALASSLSGVLSLDAGGASGSCTFNTNGGCVLQFGGGTQTLVAGVSFTGSGLHRINGGTVNIAALTTVSPSFELAAGSLDGTNTVIFTGPFTWSGGLMNGTTPGGKTVFTNSATVTINGGTKIFYGRTVDNYTTANWTAGVIQNGVAPVWNNLAGSVFDVQGDMFCQYAGSGYLTFNNSGTLKKSAGVGTATLQCITTNAGTVRSFSGTLDFPVSYTQVSGLTEMAGGNLSGTLLDIQGGLLTGTGTIAANVRNAAHVAPGTGVGLVTLTSPQTYTSTTNSLLTFQIGGASPGSGHDQLRVVNGTATLAGSLRVELTNSFVPTVGNAYTVMTFTARSGQFTNFSFPDYDFNVLQTATNIILIASNAVPTVSLLGPTNQLVCAQFQLQTSASDLDGTITNLSLLINSNTIASFTNGASRRVLVSYDYPGPATLTARATDNTGAIRETNSDSVFYTLPLRVLNLGGKLTNGQFKFCMLGEAGKSYDVLVNTNLNFPSNWTAIGVMENTNGIWRFTDPSGTNFGPRYYRARQQ